MAYAGLEESFRNYKDRIEEGFGKEETERILAEADANALDKAKMDYYNETGREFQLKPEEFMRELGVSPYAV